MGHPARVRVLIRTGRRGGDDRRLERGSEGKVRDLGSSERVMTGLGRRERVRSIPAARVRRNRATHTPNGLVLRVGRPDRGERARTLERHRRTPGTTHRRERRRAQPRSPDFPHACSPEPPPGECIPGPPGQEWPRRATGFHHPAAGLPPPPLQPRRHTPPGRNAGGCVVLRGSGLGDRGLPGSRVAPNV